MGRIIHGPTIVMDQEEYLNRKGLALFQTAKRFLKFAAEEMKIKGASTVGKGRG